MKDMNQTSQIVLPEHRELENPPTFTVYQVTRAEKGAILEAMRKIRAIDADAQEAWKQFDECLDSIERVLEEVVADWSGLVNRRGKPVQFSKDSLSDVLTDQQLVELAGKCIEVSVAGDDQRKK